MFYCGAARLATAAATCTLPVVPCCGAARLAAAACTLPAVSPLGSCVSCCAVVLPTSLPLPARCLPCRRRAVACCAALWCCPHRRCHRRLRAACRVAVGRLHVVPRCGAARLATAACVLAAVSPSGGCVSGRTVVLPASPLPPAPLPAVSPSGSCVSCRAVVLPASPPPLPPARCLSCCHRAVACRAALWCCPHRRRLRAACHVAVGQLRVMSRCGAAHLATAACALPAMSPSGGCVSCCAVVLPASPPPPPPA